MKDLFLYLYSSSEQTDYVPVTRVLNFGPHDSVLSVSINLINDDALEDLEVFHVLLSSSIEESHYVRFESYNASVAIVDQDCKLVILFLHLICLNKYISLQQ